MGWQSLLIGQKSDQRLSFFGESVRKLVSGFLVFGCSLMIPASVMGQGITNSKRDQQDKFRQLEEVLPTPNSYRTASGAPGHAYWQQKVDYQIDVKLNEADRTLSGKEVINYKNNSPDTLKYLWVQLDGNRFAHDSDEMLTQTASGAPRATFDSLDRVGKTDRGGGVDIKLVQDVQSGKKLKHTIVKTMMRVDLLEPLRPGQSTEFRIDWLYKIVDSRVAGGRGNFEYFEKDKNCIFEIAQWFPRLCPYTDVNGWQNKQFLGRGEFALEFGDYTVKITVPSDHIVGATGELLNKDQILTKEQLKRFKKSESAKTPMFIVTPEEAKKAEKSKSKEMKTWIFQGKNVRDFAWASSRKFIWDAQGCNIMGNKVMAMSLYPNEAEPMWSKFSTHAIVHTLEVYSKYTFRYPYPVAYSVNGPVGGMEYPMICFNGPRPNPDGTYPERTKIGLISVIIHEVGHNYFPMIVNSDERQWTWMDEGLNTFLQGLAEEEWDDHYPNRRIQPRHITGYMSSKGQVPIMTNSDSVLQFGPNAYSKPATALNVLRETVMGRELFDFAFQEYSQRWMFRRPMPADFFRTMEDASGVDLDWFWRGWFYSTDHVDLAIKGVQKYNISSLDPVIEKALQRKKRDAEPKSITKIRNKDLSKRVDRFPELKDFYDTYDPLAATEQEKQIAGLIKATLKKGEREKLTRKTNFYVIDIENLGGLVMPVIIKAHHEDGTSKIHRIPAEIWRRNNKSVSKMIVSEKVVKSFELDPMMETADCDRDNNYYPPRIPESRFEVFRANRRTGFSRPNPMQNHRQQEELKKARELREKRRADRERRAAKRRKSAEKKETSKTKSETKKATDSKKKPAADKKAKKDNVGDYRP